MQDWETYKAAAQEYSRLRPRLVAATLAPTANSKLQSMAANAFGVHYLNWGDWSTLIEVVTSEGEDIAWTDEGGSLYLTPAPTDTTPITVIWKMAHAPDEANLTFPTIPAHHQVYVDDLEQAIILELEADDVSRGPTLYTIGQTQVSREVAVVDLRGRAQQLRTRVIQALDEPLSVWR